MARVVLPQMQPLRWRTCGGTTHTIHNNCASRIRFALQFLASARRQTTLSLFVLPDGSSILAANPTYCTARSSVGGRQISSALPVLLSMLYLYHRRLDNETNTVTESFCYTYVNMLSARA